MPENESKLPLRFPRWDGPEHERGGWTISLDLLDAIREKLQDDEDVGLLSLEAIEGVLLAVEPLVTEQPKDTTRNAGPLDSDEFFTHWFYLLPRHAREYFEDSCRNGIPISWVEVRDSFRQALNTWERREREQAEGDK